MRHLYTAFWEETRTGASVTALTPGTWFLCWTRFKSVQYTPEFSVMDLPTSREIDLETLLRERDAQLAELTVSANFCAPEQ